MRPRVELGLVVPVLCSHLQISLQSNFHHNVPVFGMRHYNVNTSQPSRPFFSAMTSETSSADDVTKGASIGYLFNDVEQ